MAKQTTSRPAPQLAPRPVESLWGAAFPEPRGWALQWDWHALQTNNSRPSSARPDPNHGPAR
jgi:hypothetical protein